MKRQKSPAKAIAVEGLEHHPGLEFGGFLSGAISGLMREKLPTQALDTDEDWEIMKRALRKYRLPKEVKRLQADLDALRAQWPSATSPQPRDHKKGVIESPKRFTGLGQKKIDISNQLDGTRLTDIQYDCVSMKVEHGLPVTEIARRLGKHHSTVQYHLKAAEKNLNNARAYQSRARKRAMTDAEEE